MNNSKVVILGAGHVGSHAAYALAQKGICSEIVLVDIDREKAVAQALDVDDSVGFGAGETFVRAGEYGDVSDAAVVINAIGEGRKPGQTRLDLLGRSAEMAEELITSLKHFPIPGIFISITNPCDVIADYMRKGLELKKERAFGTGTLLDTARLVRAISRRSGAGRASIQAFSLGEHGDSSMIPFDAVRGPSERYEREWDGHYRRQKVDGIRYRLCCGRSGEMHPPRRKADLPGVCLSGRRVWGERRPLRCALQNRLRRN